MEVHYSGREGLSLMAYNGGVGEKKPRNTPPVQERLRIGFWFLQFLQ
jgi:hypothetical protein